MNKNTNQKSYREQIADKYDEVVPQITTDKDGLYEWIESNDIARMDEQAKKRRPTEERGQS